MTELTCGTHICDTNNHVPEGLTILGPFPGNPTEFREMVGKTETALGSQKVKGLGMT